MVFKIKYGQTGKIIVNMSTGIYWRPLQYVHGHIPRYILTSFR